MVERRRERSDLAGRAHVGARPEVAGPEPRGVGGQLAQRIGNPRRHERREEQRAAEAQRAEQREESPLGLIGERRIVGSTRPTTTSHGAAVTRWYAYSSPRLRIGRIDEPGVGLVACVGQPSGVDESRADRNRRAADSGEHGPVIVEERDDAAGSSGVADREESREAVESRGYGRDAGDAPPSCRMRRAIVRLQPPLSRLSIGRPTVR